MYMCSNNYNPTPEMNGSMMTDDTKKKLMKSVVTGGVLALAGSIGYGVDTVQLLGISVPSVVPLFVSGVGSSLISDIAHKKVFPQLVGAGAKLGDLTATALGAGIAGAASVGILQMGVGLPNTESMFQAALLGAGSYVAAEYIESRFLETNGAIIY